MTNREKAEAIYDQWAEEVGVWSDPVIYPRDQFEACAGATGWNPWVDLIDRIEKALDGT